MRVAAETRPGRPDVDAIWTERRQISRETYYYYYYYYAILASQLAQRGAAWRLCVFLVSLTFHWRISLDLVYRSSTKFDDAAL